MLKLMNTVRQSWLRESRMDILILPPSLGISRDSSQKATPRHIREWLMSCQLDFPASPSQLQASKKESKTKEIFGPQQSRPFALYDRGMRIWKTCRPSFHLTTSDEFLETWPKQGMMLDGACWGLTIVERRIDGRDGGLWRTPNSHIIDAKKSVKKLSGRKPSDPQVGLADQVMWPTPNRPDGGRIIPKDADWKGRTVAYNQKGKKVQVGLESAVKKWPTPRKEMAHGYCKSRLENPELARKECRLEDQVSGQLNPDWVEWLMGFPIGWTSLNPLKELIWLSWDIDPADMEDDSFIPRVVMGIKDRVNRLKALGNGQVPKVFEVVWKMLEK